MLQKLIYVLDDGIVAIDVYCFGFLVYHKRVSGYAITKGYTPQVQ
jgi:hypothetical protein